MTKHHNANRINLNLEQLEDRVTPSTTTYLIMDFTPDSHAGGLADTMYQIKTPGGKYAPNFFDFNGDHKIDAKDVQMAANAITYKVQTEFNSFLGQNVHVYYGDYASQTNWGTQWINYGKQYSNVEVAVMYLGGTSSSGAGVIGRAPLASNGYNVEGFGETYTRSIAQWMVNNTPNATASDFVDRVAQTAAHELGHMLGLKHTNGASATNIMSPSQPSNAGAAQFINANVAVEGGGTQNAFAELRASFAGQAEQHPTGGLGGQAEHVEGGADDHDFGDGLGEGGSGAAYDPLAGANTGFVAVQGFDVVVNDTRGAQLTPSPTVFGTNLGGTVDVGLLSASRLQQKSAATKVLDSVFSEIRFDSKQQGGASAGRRAEVPVGSLDQNHAAIQHVGAVPSQQTVLTDATPDAADLFRVKGL